MNQKPLTTPARPRNAASLVIHRESRKGYEVLMGRRGSKARFKPGVYVFPGGIVERADYRVRPKKQLRNTVVQLMGVGGSIKKANAIAMAAVRESFEEVGLFFGETGKLGTSHHKTWIEFAKRGMTPNLSELDYLGRAITPSIQPIRFHARFFSIACEKLVGSLLGDGELEDLRWVKLDQSEGLEMMLVQKMIMDTLQLRLQGKAAPAQKLFFAWGKINIVDS
jgi:8-oxo-dGTP pyrophosphatase MutT (NUDIX family)